jgi:hypothetical protein
MAFGSQYVWAPNRIDVVARGNDQAVWHRS